MKALRRVAIPLVAALLVSLTGCVRLEATGSIGSDDKVSLSVTLAMRGAAAAAVQQMCDTTLRDALPAARSTPYSQDGYAGCVLTMQGVSLLMASSAALTFDHKDGEFSFTLWPVVRGMAGAASADLRFDAFSFALTFPGEVLTHSGSSQVSGTTVTWTDPNDLLDEGLKATAKDGGSSLARWLLALGIIAVVLVLVAVGVYLVVRRSRDETAAIAVAVLPGEDDSSPQPPAEQQSRFPNQPGSEPEAPAEYPPYSPEQDKGGGE